MPPHPFTVVVLAATVVLAADEKLELRVEAKTKVSKSIETKLDLRSTKVAIGLGGDSGGGSGGPKVRLVDVNRITVTDEYVAVAEGRATKLLRSFDELEGSILKGFEAPEGFEENSNEEKQEKTSPLERKKVRLEWTEGAWEAAWAAGEEGDDVLLEGLDGDLDCAGFLPGKSVAVGDRWEIEPARFRPLLSPGGRLHLAEQVPDPMMRVDEIWRAIEERLEGKASATYRGKRTVDGVEVAVIALEAELRSAGDLRDKGTLEATLELEGELLWDPRSGHLRSYDVHGQATLGLESKRTVKLGDRSTEMKQRIDFEGTFETKAKFD